MVLVVCARTLHRTRPVPMRGGGARQRADERLEHQAVRLARRGRAAPTSALIRRSRPSGNAPKRSERAAKPARCIGLLSYNDCRPKTAPPDRLPPPKSRLGGDGSRAALWQESSSTVT